MDEVAKRAKAVGGWQKLARILYAKMDRNRPNKKRPKHSAEFQSAEEKQKLLNSLSPVLHREISIRAWVAANSQTLKTNFGVRAEGTYRNKISKLLKPYPRAPMATNQKLEGSVAMLRALGEQLENER